MTPEVEHLVVKQPAQSLSEALSSNNSVVRAPLPTVGTIVMHKPLVCQTYFTSLLAAT